MTRDEQIFEWQHGKWETSAKGALWKNIGDWHVAVFKAKDKTGVWHMIFKLKTSTAECYLPGECYSEEKAKLAVLGKVADAMKL